MEKLTTVMTLLLTLGQPVVAAIGAALMPTRSWRSEHAQWAGAAAPSKAAWEAQRTRVRVTRLTPRGRCNVKIRKHRFKACLKCRFPPPATRNPGRDEKRVSTRS